MVNYISTRGGGNPLAFEDVLLAGLAPDGGLYVPEAWPALDLDDLKGKSYKEIAAAVMFPFVEGSIEHEDFNALINKSYSTFRHEKIVPLHHLKDNLYIMEQFYGPTIAFKDVALQLLGNLFDYALKKRGEHITIVGATSGDTGSAAIEGCKVSDQLDIFILYPDGRVSDVQRKQMTTVHADNVHNLAIEGTFDDCQNMVKAMFNDAEYRKEMNLSAVNSINWARIMAQIVYYVTTVLELGAPEKEVTFVVPTGNFGNVFAGYCARQMGVPLKLVVATNENDILTRFFESGEMKADGVVPTISPSMDIEISSNFERYLFELLGRDAEALSDLMHSFKDTGKFSVSEDLLNKARQDFTAQRANQDEILQTIKTIHEEHDYILDPHTAIGVKAALHLETAGPVVALATAHASKFPDATEKATGQHPALPDHLSDLFEREEKLTELPNDFDTVTNFIRENV